MEGGSLAGLTIGITAQRRADEQARMFRSRGAEVLHGATLSLSPAGDDPALRAATEAVVAEPPHFLLASTGYGMRAWLAAAEGWGQRDELLAALGQARVANRGAKAASANTATGLAEWWRAPNERFEELVHRLLDEPLSGARVVVQLHGMPVPALIARLTAAGATVVEIDAYRSTMPEDSAPGIAVVEAACAGDLAAVTFTTAPSLHNLFALATRSGRQAALRDAFNGPVVAACVGPVCAEAALEEGVAAPLVPERSRLVPLVEALTARIGAR
ncbi:MAG: uroporphyrinogen-III synthase [Acidimicrobiales bacterium]